MSIHNSQFSVTGTFNNANGDQVNYNHTTITHIHGDDEKVTECTIFSQFENVKRGYVIGMKELGSVDLSEWDWHWQNGELVWRRPKSARKTISTIQVHPDQQSKFTAIAYEGEDAQEAWEKDFKQFSRASRTGLFKLFGINRSEIPMLIFHHELIPVAHFYTKSLWMGLYMEYLRRNKRCKDEYLWMDTRRGILCSGPAGPRVIFPGLPNKDESALRALPSTLNMLEEGTCVAFFSKFGSNVDVGVLNCAWRFHERTYLDDLFPKMMEDYQHKGNNHSQLMTNYPYLEHLWRNPLHHLTIDIIGGLRFDTIYSPLLEPIARWPPEAPGPWRWSDVCGLMEKTRADGGLTRFKLVSQGGEVHLEAIFDWERFWRGWLPQASRVFDYLETTVHRESFSMVDPPWLRLQSTRREYEAYDGLSGFFDLCDAIEETRPIYLFLYPPPMVISELTSWPGGHAHFWSFDEDGQSRIPEKEWERWDIPILTPSILAYSDGLVSWPSHIYTALRKWQIARGFDPSAAGWAQECGYPELEIIRKQPGVFLVITATQDER
ncbi:hypothetical protein Moror_8582 [Moniliophthora roreri MCA 2997]|uniref:Uncharacterized protein n=1 Tax=Moniliophthora roreri (strain MCA 2997) TaxID=1381753 RepID=V2W6J1_MONRO|nr:hypothetical protein Moror_8582 [Moniliophthora roreri MCA 2997]